MDLNREALHETGAFADSGPWDSDLLHVEDVYLKAGGDFLVGVLDDRVVAMGALLPTGDNAAEIKRMRVHPEFQRRGYGRMILNELEAAADRLGVKRLYLDTTTAQAAAIALYHRHGYRELDRKPWRDVELVLMEREL